ncbi:CvpA family protein [Liquorilactobacillus mali]|uniref:CvpA family protein n=1 Tax=Liquorilactobacillus mali TaxID=1618 RepID=UPI0029530D09|nr:CvpA family protein [Liquorilactobacillus mali]MDV7756837.1 CvpA family protein [Liquorilactobacillus mali]
MILSVILIVILFFAFIHGMHRGLILMLLNLVGLILLFFIAHSFAGTVGGWLQQLVESFNQTSATWSADQGTLSGSSTFYYGLAYWLIMLIGGFVIYRIIRTFNLVKKIPVIGQLNALAGGAVSIILTYLIMFAALIVMQSWPTTSVRETVSESGVAQFILEKTPVMSQNLKDWLQENDSSV